MLTSVTLLTLTMIPWTMVILLIKDTNSIIMANLENITVIKEDLHWKKDFLVILRMHNVYLYETIGKMKIPRSLCKSSLTVMVKVQYEGKNQGRFTRCPKKVFIYV